MKSSWWMFSVVLLLAGCRANSDSLDDFLRQVESQARQEVAKLKPEQEYVATSYASAALRLPFELPKEAVIATQPVVKKECWQPADRTRSGRLERYPLSQLRLKGIMGSGNSVSGLVQTPQGTVERVLAGQYIGQNNGKVTLITPSYLMINETLPDGLGCWQQRKVKLALR